MATRLYFRESEVGFPPVTVTPSAGWTESDPPADAGPMYSTPSSGGDDLTTVTGFIVISPGAFRLHRQWVSEPIEAGINFDGSETYKCQIQCLESNADDNLFAASGIRIVSEDGSTVRHTIKAVGTHGPSTEVHTSLRNKTVLDGDAGTASYTTVEGDRLVVEIGMQPAGGTTPDGSSRWGSGGSGGDLPEDETDTSNQKDAWFECSLDIPFIGAGGGGDDVAPVAGGGYYP